jgi:oligosaccharide repeat unit polymerase
LIPFPFNTSTYLNVFYLDWGLIGVFIGPFLFGLIGNWLYRYTCARGRVWHVVLMAFVTHACLSSIGTNVLISTPQWEYVLALILLALLARKSPSGVSLTVTSPTKAHKV